MVARTKARKRALDVLFESELQGLAPGGTLSARVASASPPMSEYAISLVEGVVAHRERIDELLSTYAVGWTLDRMPVVDRNLLRIGTYEILYRDDVPGVRQRPIGPDRRTQADPRPLRCGAAACP